MSFIQFGKEIKSISRLNERLWIVPRKEEVIPIPEQERAIIAKQLFEKLDWKEKAKINLGLCAPPEAPKTRKIITGEPRSIYIFEIIEKTGEKRYDGADITCERYFEPFTKTEFKEARVKEEGDNKQYGDENTYLTIPDVNPVIWKKLPFVYDPGYSSDGIIDPARDGDYDLKLFPNRLSYFDDLWDPWEEKKAGFYKKIEMVRMDFDKLKDDKLYQQKLKEYFEELRRKSEQLSPPKPEVYRNPKDVIDDFLGKI